MHLAIKVSFTLQESNQKYDITKVSQLHYLYFDHLDKNACIFNVINFRFKELPNIEKAFRKVAAWPLVHNNTMRTGFQEFAMNNLSLSNKEATALTVSTVNLTSAFSSDIFDVDVSIFSFP